MRNSAALAAKVNSIGVKPDEVKVFEAVFGRLKEYLSVDEEYRRELREVTQDRQMPIEEKRRERNRIANARRLLWPRIQELQWVLAEIDSLPTCEKTPGEG